MVTLFLNTVFENFLKFLFILFRYQIFNQHHLFITPYKLLRTDLELN